MGENFLKEVFPQTPFQELSIIFLYGKVIRSPCHFFIHVGPLLPHSVALTTG